jgi:hypothetical protein
MDVVVDELDSPRLDALDALVETTPRMRPPFARLRVVQGVEMDPSRPGRAVVYVMVMDGHEYAQFRRSVGRTFPDAQVGAAAKLPQAEATLAGLGSMDFVRKVDPAGTLTPPPLDPLISVARRAQPREGQGEAIVSADGKVLHSGGDLARPPAPARAEISTGGLHRPREEADDASIRRVYVVWVSPRDRASR